MSSLFPIAPAVSTRPVKMGTPEADFWANREVTPLLAKLREQANRAPRVDIRWFGAVADYPSNDADDDAIGASTDNSAAFAEAITYARERGINALYIPPGNWRVDTPLNLTGMPGGFSVYGEGYMSRIVGRTSGRPVFDVTGSSFCRFGDFSVRGTGASTTYAAFKPSAAFLCSRDSSNGSAGQHWFYNVLTDGWHTKAAVATISSEANTYVGCNFGTLADGAWSVTATDQNELVMATPYSTFPATWSGGNTTHTFIRCLFLQQGATAAGGNLWFKNVRQAAVSGCFFTANINAEAGIRISGGVSGLTVSGGTGEIEGATYGVLVDAGAVLRNSYFDGFHANVFFGDDGSLVEFTTIDGLFSAVPYAVDLYDANGVRISCKGLSTRVRHTEYDVKYMDPPRPGGSMTHPTGANIAGVEFTDTQQRSDGRTIHRLHSGSLGTDSRNEFGQARSYIQQTRVQYIETNGSASITPTVRETGATIHVTLENDITFHPPTELIDLGVGSPTHDDFDGGCFMTVVFKQDTTGGWNVQLDGVINANHWLVRKTIGATTTLHLHLVNGVWEQIGGSIRYLNLGEDTFTKVAVAGPQSGNIYLDNGNGDTPGIHFYEANATNYGIDVSGSQLRFVRNLDEAGGSVIIAADVTAVTVSAGLRVGTTIATNATSGHFKFPTCAGAPTGTPDGGVGSSVIDSTNKKFYWWDGAAWIGGTNPGAFT